MKKSRRILTFALILVLMFSLSVSAFADDAKHQSTKEYMDALSTVAGISCEPGEIVKLAGKEYEIVSVRYSGDRTWHESAFVAGVCEDGTDVILSMNFLQFDPKNLVDVLLAVNDLNAGTTGTKIYVDRSDNTIAAEMYLIMGEEMDRDIALTGTTTFIGFTDTMYDSLVQFAA